MFNNSNYYPYYNNLQSITGYKFTPVAKIEETNSIFPDWQGSPLFFFDLSRNEFYVKQRKVQTGEVEMLRYPLSGEPLNTGNIQKEVNTYDEQIRSLQEAIERLNEAVGVKVKKAAKDDEQ